MTGPEGPFERDVAVHPGAVAILCVDEAGKVAFVRQYRATIDELSYEIPAGTLDSDGESLLDAAKRELLEEVGVEAKTWKQLGTFLNSPGWTDQRITIFEARQIRKMDRQPAGPEESESEVLWLDLDEIREIQRTSPSFDSTTAVALLRLFGDFFG